MYGRLLLILCALLLMLATAGSVSAGFDQETVGRGIVAVLGTARDGEQRHATGAIVSLNRLSGFVVTEGGLVASSESVKVLGADGVPFNAQTIRLDGKGDVAILKVNGLPGKALTFAGGEPVAGDVVWSAFNWPTERKLGLSKGTVRQHVPGGGANYGSLTHTAAVGASVASVLLNDCGEIVGFSARPGAVAPRLAALTSTDLGGILRSLNIAPPVSSAVCLSEIAVARNKADQAAAQAQQAQAEASRAQATADALSDELARSNERNRTLEEQSLAARERADAAVAVAARAEQDAERTRLELEDTTERILQETQAMVRLMEQSRDQNEERLKAAIREQSKRADANEQLLIIVGGLLALVLVAGLLFVLIRKVSQPAAVGAAPMLSRSSASPKTEPAEYVLDGRDEDGIRYLLRISGDQLSDDTGVVIGRNPKDSPYIINHSDVSRKHARMRVVQSKVYIEDLGSTNGTLVNGQAIEDKGPGTVAHGDQIAIGSVVMKLRVLAQ